MTYLFFIVLLSYLLMQSVETISFSSRIAGKLSGRLALGTTIQTSIFTMSRIFLPPLLLSFSYMIESDLSLQMFLLIAISLIFSSFVASIFIIFRLDLFQSLFQKLFFFYDSCSLPAAIFKVITRKKTTEKRVHLTHFPKLRELSVKKILTSTISYFFLSTGFLIAFSMAILIPEYRMTMSQLTTAFHGIGAIFLAMYIDPMMSKSLDIKTQNNQWVNNIYSIIIGRSLSYLFSFSVFLGLYLYAWLT